MPDMFNLTPEMKEYFNTLPQSVKTDIMLSGAKLNSLDDLKAVAEDLTKYEQK